MFGYSSCLTSPAQPSVTRRPRFRPRFYVSPYYCHACSWSIFKADLLFLLLAMKQAKLKPVAVANTVDRDVLFDSFFFHFHFSLFIFHFSLFTFHFSLHIFNSIFHFFSISLFIIFYFSFFTLHFTHLNFYFLLIKIV